METIKKLKGFLFVSNNCKKQKETNDKDLEQNNKMLIRRI